MTDDYKKTLLDYITEFNAEEPINTEIFTDIKDVDRSEWIDFLPSAWSSFMITGMIKSNTADRIVLYGGYVEQGGTYTNNSKGIIIITDQDLKPIQTIYEFTSGTKLRPIQCMYQEEDGQFVALDCAILPNTSGTQEVRQALTNCEKRFLMLNDISISQNDEYEINLRKSYALGDGYRNMFTREIFKNPSSSHYSFVGVKMSLGSGGYQPNASKIINVKINVGSANEWNKAETDDGFIYGGANVYYDSSDNANWKFLITHNVGDQAVYGWEGQNSSITATYVLYDPTFFALIDSSGIKNQVVFTSNTKAYFVVNNQHWGISGTPVAKYIGLFEVDFSNRSVQEMFLRSLGNYDYCDLCDMKLQVVNGELYIMYTDNANSNIADYYVQRFKGIWNPILIKEQAPYFHGFNMFYISQTFNLLKMNIFTTAMTLRSWIMEQITEVYNIANYNGEPYTNYNSLIGKYVNVYSNDEIVFSRNLTNVSITNNYTMSSVEIPNTYLNGIDLNPKDLVGETKMTLVEDGNTISKNIYEVLYLNYINTISVKNNDNQVVSSVGRYINTNINEGTEENQRNTKCSKIRINYQDDTTAIKPIGWDRVDDTHKVAEFTIYVDKAISNIDLISNDELTTYITIERELETGKYYTFKQYLKVE